MLITGGHFTSVRAQRHLLLGGGTSFYMGDLCRSLECATPGLDFLVGYHLKESYQYAIRLEGHVFQMRSDDQNTVRNLSFFSTNFSVDLQGLYFFTDQLNTPISPYIASGIGVLSFNPKATYEGTTYALQPLQTEGVSYSKTAFYIPMGIGVKFNLPQHFQLFVEANYHYAFHDRLDDVSETYVENSSLIGLATSLADRTSEGGFTPENSTDGEHWSAGSTRGESNNNDAFWFINLKLNIPLFDSKMHCPSDFWE